MRLPLLEESLEVVTLGGAVGTLRYGELEEGTSSVRDVRGTGLRKDDTRVRGPVLAAELARD